MIDQPMKEILLRKAMQGDTKAFGQIIRKYQSLVYAVALQIVGDSAAAQDISQDTFVSAFKALKDLRREDSFPSWLHSIARNRALSWRKERERIAPLDEAGALWSPPDPTGPEMKTDRNEAQAFEAGVRQIILSLSDALRFPVILCYQRDISTAEAACFLGIKEGTLRKRLHDGKKKLQEKIVQMAEKTFQEFRLPPGFARRCICGCQRSRLRKMQIKNQKGGGPNGR